MPVIERDTEAERDFSMLLQELRVVQTGVQILAAFLLTIPFTNRFHEITTFQKTVFVITRVAAAAATALVIGPVSYHRLKVGEDRAHLVRITILLARCGLVSLLVAGVFGVFLALDVAIGHTVASVLGALVAGLYIGIWYVLPALWHRRS
jgi:Family of unknown function (DUF6328)